MPAQSLIWRPLTPGQLYWVAFGSMWNKCWSRKCGCCRAWGTRCTSLCWVFMRTGECGCFPTLWVLQCKRAQNTFCCSGCAVDVYAFLVSAIVPPPCECLGFAVNAYAFLVSTVISPTSCNQLQVLYCKHTHSRTQNGSPSLLCW